MSNISLIIEERAAPIVQFMVGRLLPFRQKRMVGLFIYMDRMGPVTMTHVKRDPHATTVKRSFLRCDAQFP